MRLLVATAVQATDLVLAAILMYSFCGRQPVESLHRVEEGFSIRVVQLTELTPHILNIPTSTSKEEKAYHFE